MKSTKDVAFIVVLVLLLASQVGLRIVERAAEDSRALSASIPGALVLGDTIAAVSDLLDSQGNATLVLANGRAPTIVLAFSSTCFWCEEAAPHWRAWLSDPPEGYRIVAMTSDSLHVGSEYALAKGWNVEIYSTVAAPAGVVARSLVNLTPWAFVFDPSGELLHQQNGAELTSLPLAVTGALP